MICISTCLDTTNFQHTLLCTVGTAATDVSFTGTTDTTDTAATFTTAVITLDSTSDRVHFRIVLRIKNQNMFLEFCRFDMDLCLDQLVGNNGLLHECVLSAERK